MRKDYLIFGSPLIEEDEINEVVDSLRSGWIGTGPKVARFEEDFKNYIGVRHAAAVSSCTAGLHLSMLVAGVGLGDEVITTPMTFGATANAIVHAGAEPVFVDVDLKTMNIDPQKIEEKITKRTKAIIPVHFAGRPCDMEAILDLAREHNLLVIDDAAHAVGAEYQGRKIGSVGDMTAFSFYVTKNIVTGEGGMVTTNTKELFEKIQTYALHGMSRGAWKRYSDEGYQHYQIVAPGYKYNMMDISAALGIHQLKRIHEYRRRREEIWARYDAAFADLPLRTPAPPETNTRHARHLYTILLDIDKVSMSRDQFLQELHDRNIGTGVHFISLHLHPYYRDRYRFRSDDFPHALHISDRTVSLPLSAKLTEHDVEDVIEAVREVVLGNR
jgi:dTDP-4-amino-4,6-dideoxygalactose transaminase